MGLVPLHLINQFIQERFLPFVLLNIFSGYVGKPNQSLFFFLIEFLWYCHPDHNIQVAFTAGLQMWHTRAADSEPGFALSACRNLQFHLAVQSIDFDSASQCCRNERNILSAIQVITIAFEIRIVLYKDVYIEVTFGTTIRSWFPFPATRIRTPESAPAGILISMVLFLLTTPLP